MERYKAFACFRALAFISANDFGDIKMLLALVCRDIHHQPAIPFDDNQSPSL